VYSTTLLDILSVLTALLGIEFAGSGLYQGACPAAACLLCRQPCATHDCVTCLRCSLSCQ
jgi:hypothetical protein